MRTFTDMLQPSFNARLSSQLLCSKTLHSNVHFCPNAGVLVALAASSACQYSIHNVTYKMKQSHRTENHVSIFPQLSLFRSLACSTLCVHYSAWTFIHCSSPTKSMGRNFSEALKRLRVNCVRVGWGCPERTGYLLQKVSFLINIFVEC